MFRKRIGSSILIYCRILLPCFAFIYMLTYIHFILLHILPSKSPPSFFTPFITTIFFKIFKLYVATAMYTGMYRYYCPLLLYSNALFSLFISMHFFIFPYCHKLQTQKYNSFKMLNPLPLYLIFTYCSL